MNNNTLSPTLDFDFGDAPAATTTAFVDKPKTRLAPVQKPKPKPIAVPADCKDAVALWRQDELDAVWQRVAEAEERAKHDIAAARSQAAALSEEVVSERIRMRPDSPTYDYDFARQVLGDAALPPKPAAPVPSRPDPFLAFLENTNV